MSPFISRRHFMAESLLGITAAAAATYAATATTAIAQAPAGQVAANDKIGVAIVGTGGRGGSHISQFRGDAKCTILYLVDPDSTKVSNRLIDEIAATQGDIKPQRITDMRQAYEDKAVDIVTCATCNHWHALAALWAVQAGKHVYVEKPGNHNIHEGLALEAASKKYNRVVQIGTQCRSIAANAGLAKFVLEGGIGEVKFTRGLCYKRRGTIGPAGNFPIPFDVDYDLWSGPAPIKSITRRQFHYDWHWQRLYGNGDLGNQGSHQTDIARWFLGADRYPQAVITYGGRLGYVDAGDVANTEISVYDYGDKCMVFETRGLETGATTIPVGQKPGTLVGVIAYGEKGYAIQGQATSGQTYGYSTAYDLEGNLLREFRGGGDGDHYRNFLEAVAKGDPSFANADATCGKYSAAVSHFGNISYYLGETNKASVAEIKEALKAIKSLDDNGETVDRTVEHLTANKVDLAETPMSIGPLLRFDLATNRFIGNDAANEMLTRDYRAPYIVPKAADV
ncbi:MAG: Gfo/Idh/MocA family oxidoreductase [Planctomycetaceae bacterium]|nr:Gfo/Idh/MocA family oxidoreductase [Planctomycetaceae bacterium]